MKRILFLILCISLISASFAGADEADKAAQLFQAAKIITYRSFFRVSISWAQVTVSGSAETENLSE